ncbi:hypothetical protein F4779DRAFT_624121 [Xylariaceae sp. FL0662B]|nr:hypothetical protein F4779DRAFT_624121 [Xylariaceae sp. FL0662B]
MADLIPPFRLPKPVLAPVLVCKSLGAGSAGGIDAEEAPVSGRAVSDGQRPELPTLVIGTPRPALEGVRRGGFEEPYHTEVAQPTRALVLSQSPQKSSVGFTAASPPLLLLPKPSSPALLQTDPYLTDAEMASGTSFAVEEGDLIRDIRVPVAPSACPDEGLADPRRSELPTPCCPIR